MLYRELVERKRAAKLCCHICCMIEHSSTGEVDYMLHIFRQTSDDGLSLEELGGRTEQGRLRHEERQGTSLEGKSLMP